MPRDKLVGFQASAKEKREIQNRARELGFSSVSSYLRFCEADFNARRHNAFKQREISIIEDCIKLLEGHLQEVTDSLLQQSLKDLEQNLKGGSEEKSESFKENEENLKENLKGFDEQSLKETKENLKGYVEREFEKDRDRFRPVINTLIGIKKAKGKVSTEDFRFQAERCGVKPNELREFYDNHYDEFVEAVDTYTPKEVLKENP